MAVTCEQCGHWSLSGEHDCPAVRAKFMAEAYRKQIVIQLPDNPGPVYDDLLIALERLASSHVKPEGGE